MGQVFARRTRYVITRGEVTLDVLGEGNGLPVVLIPSSARDSFDYDDVAEGIASAGYRVLRPQSRGVGASNGPMDNLGLRDLAGDIAMTIEHCAAGPAVVVGHAFGNWIARMTAVSYPRLVRGVVIAAAAAKNVPSHLLVCLVKAGDMTVPDNERLDALRQAFFAPGNDAAAWLAGWHPQVAEYQRRILADPNEDEWWSAGQAPVLDLQALQDPFRPRNTASDIKHDLGARVTIAEIDNASHALFPEQPGAVVRAVVDWIRSIDGGSDPQI